jgi:multidrug efflux pump subunit AcrA (membrane-fusion protein)
MTGLAACHNNGGAAADGKDSAKTGAPAEGPAAAEEVKTPVTVAGVEISNLSDSIELNATSVFLQSSYLKSVAIGYVTAVDARPGEFIPAGKVLFTIETKESKVIGNSITALDSSFRFSGVSHVRSTGPGYVTQLNHQVGDYVQDGEQLAVISDINSFAFLLNLPYELRPYVLNKSSVDLILPDGVRLSGRIQSVMPTVDSASQTQQLVIKVNAGRSIPQNLIARVRISKDQRSNAQTLPKSAIMADETQTSFWVMKLIDSVTAVKQPIKKGIELNNKVEILEPRFGKDDRIVVTGNYGLPDTAKVIIEKPE